MNEQNRQQGDDDQSNLRRVEDSQREQERQQKGPAQGDDDQSNLRRVEDSQREQQRQQK